MGQKAAEQTIVAPGIEVPGVWLGGEGCGSLDRHARARWLVGVQIVDVPVEGDGNHRAALPKTAKLLPLEIIPECERCDCRVCLNVPELDGLVAGCSDCTLAIRAPR